jgi:hypothetical protein
VAGVYDIVYADGSSERIWVRGGHEIGHWWGIEAAPETRRGNDAVDFATTRVAWRGANGTWKNVGLYMYGWNNPHPEKQVVAIRATALPVPGRKAGIMLAAISFSDRPVQFDVRIRSHGLPACWSQAAVYHALAEGLAGITDQSRAFRRVRVAPRWAATRSDSAEVALHYPASDGYCAYRYTLDRHRRRIVLDLTGSFEQAAVHCLLPPGAEPTRVLVDGAEHSFRSARVEKSTYADFVLTKMPLQSVVIEWTRSRTEE